MDQPSLEKEDKDEEIQQTVEVVVHTPSGTQFPIHLGSASDDQIENIHNTIRSSFETLASTKGLTFVDQMNCTRHFNTNHVTCVEVRIR